MKTLVIAEHDGRTLANATSAALAAAARLQQPTDLLVCGYQIEPLCREAAQLDGVARVLQADDAVLDHPLAENLAALIDGLRGEYRHILLPATTFGKDLAPRIAALAGVNPLSDVIEIISADTYKRPIYAGNAVATVKNHQALQVLTVRTTAFADSIGTAAQAADIEPVPCHLPEAAVRFVDRQISESDRPELACADIVVSGGRGVGSAENFELLYQLADKLGAAVGASRAAVDSGYVANDMQVGQTGKMVAPKLYIAAGISGAIQHLAGMKDSGTIVAINKDEEAPIFSVADYGLVGDLFDVLPELTAKL